MCNVLYCLKLSEGMHRQSDCTDVAWNSGNLLSQYAHRYLNCTHLQRF